MEIQTLGDTRHRFFFPSQLVKCPPNSDRIDCFSRSKGACGKLRIASVIFYPFKTKLIVFQRRCPVVSRYMDIGDHPTQPCGVVEQVLLGIVGEIGAFCGLESFMEYRQCLISSSQPVQKESLE